MASTTNLMELPRGGPQRAVGRWLLAFFASSHKKVVEKEH